MSRFADVADQACEFCAVVAGARPDLVVGAQMEVVAFLHPEPATRGHLLIVPRRHSQDLYEVGDDELSQTMQAARRWAVATRDRLGTDGVNLINACGPAAWQTVFHFHVHVIPRYGDDAMSPPWIPRPADASEIADVADQLRRSESRFGGERAARSH